jgi:molybdopterin molybdotransferase
MESFFNVKRPEEVHAIIDDFAPAGDETVPLYDALGRVLSGDVASPEDLPGFFRSAMDGYAVRSRDTFGASESLPALLEVAGEVHMGRSPEGAVTPGRAVRISTGGMLPDGADGVVMVEYCHLLDEKTLEVSRSISPLENVIQPGDDYRRGAAVLPRGSVLRPQDVGLMAGLGIPRLRVYRKPVVAVLSTGDEIVPLDASPGPGQVRDINRYTLQAFCRRMGAEAVFMGHCPDDFDALRKAAAGAVGTAHTLWISGGSSVGARDLTLKVFETLPDFELLVHGISISPGKPTIIGRCGRMPLIGLPGHVASALVVAEVFLARLIRRLAGRVDEAAWERHEVTATLARNIESAGGREDYVRVRLSRGPDGLVADPVFGKSGLISILVESHGLVKIDMNTEGLYQGQRVKVWVLSA